MKELAKDPANGRAQYLLGLFYFYAVEVRWNGDRFLELVDSGWRAGDVLSGFFILYRDGEGNKKEMTEKYVEHMKKLLPMAKAGDPFAMRQIAILYERGLGRKINMDQARRGCAFLWRTQGVSRWTKVSRGMIRSLLSPGS